MSIAMRVGVIVGAVLTVVLVAMFIILRMTQESAMLERAQVHANQIDHLIVGSIASAMGQGVSDVKPLLRNAAAVQNVRELRVLPAASISAESEKQMDPLELQVLHSRTGVMFEEDFNKEPVMRAVEPLIADAGCASCHDCKVGDALATVSLRYSMADHHAEITGERWLIVGMAVPTILFTFFGVMYMSKRSIVQPLGKGISALAVMATGDLTVRMEGDYHGDLGLLKDSINKVGSSLNDALRRVSEAVSATASASNEISASTEQMATGGREQTSQASEVASAVEEMTKTITENSKNAGVAAKTAEQARVSAEQGGQVVDDTVNGMKRIAGVVHKSAETVRELGKSSDQIGEIISVIDDIADQTNLLALNAAIEAARAGDQGRGFAVVADEVRKLAERTTNATKEIAGMIKKIQSDTIGAVRSMEEGTREVEHGIALADKAGTSLKEIVGVSQKLTEMVMHIAAASGEQSQASEQIAKNVEAISMVTSETAQGTQQIARAAEDLNRLTDNLQNLIAQFKTSQSGGGMSVSSLPHGDVRVRADGALVEG